MVRRFSAALAFSLGLAALIASGPAAAQAPKNISMTVGVCDPVWPLRCIKPDTNGAVPVTGSFTPSGTADSNLKQVNGATVNVGAGAAGTGTQRVTTSTDSTIGTITNPVGIKGSDGAAIASVTNPVPTTSADVRTAIQNITAADVGTTSSAGQNSVNVITGSPTANSSVTWALNGQSSISVTASGTFSATAQLETSADGGTTYVASTAKQMGTGATSSSVTGKGIFRVDVTGATNLRLRATAYTSGTLAAYATNSPSAGLTQIINPVPLRGIDGLAVASASNGAPVQTVAGSTGGSTPVSKIVANNTTSVAICASACTLYGVAFTNNSATVAYVKLYNATQGATTCGAGTPVDRLLIPANASGAGIVVPIGGSVGAAYGTALTACTTTGLADNDTGSPAATTYLETFYTK